MDQLLRETGGLKSYPYYLVFIAFFARKKCNVFKVLRLSFFGENRPKQIANATHSQCA